MSEITKLNRRNFLKKSGILAATIAGMPYIISSRALGKNGVLPPSERITVGHIGVGGQGGGLLGNFLNIPNAQSIAVCDPFESRRIEKAGWIDKHYAQAFGEDKYRGCKQYSDFRDLLQDASIDAVVIATPDHWHVPIAIAAAKAGKHVYVEKPLGISIAENQAMREAVQRYGTIFQYGTQQRSGQNFRFACELVRNGRIGKLHTIEVWCPGMYAYEEFNEPGGSTKPIPVPAGFDYDMWLGPAAFSPYTSDRCTPWGTYYVYDNSLGFIAGWGAHPLDIAQWGNDSDNTAPVEYAGTGKIYAGGLYDVVNSWDIWCRYENGVKMHFMSDEVAKPIIEKYHPRFWTHGTTFHGDLGWVSVDRGGLFTQPASLVREIIGPTEIHLYQSDNHYQNFIDGVRLRKQAVSPVEAAVQSDFISQIGNILIRTGRQKLMWDPRTETIRDFPEANRMCSRTLRNPWHL